MNQPSSSPLSSAPATSQLQPTSNQPRHVEKTLPILPLLHYISYDLLMVQKKRLLRLLIVPDQTKTRILTEQPDLLDLLDLPAPCNPSNDYIETKIQHLDYASLQIKLTAFKQTQERLGVREQVILALEIATLGLDMLAWIQMQIQKSDATAKAGCTCSFQQDQQTASRREVSGSITDERSKLQKVWEGDVAINRRLNRSTSPTTPTKNRQGSQLGRSPRTSRMKNIRPQVRICNCSRPKESQMKAIAANGSETRIQAQQMEASNLIKQVETVLTIGIAAGQANPSGDIRSSMIELSILRAQLNVIQGGVNFGMKSLRNLISVIEKDPTQFNMLYRAQLQLAKWESESFRDLMPSLATLGGIIKHAQFHRNDFVALAISIERARLVMANSYFDMCQNVLDDCADRLSKAGVPPRLVNPGQDPHQAKLPTSNSSVLAALHPVLAVMLAQFFILAIPWEVRRGRFATAGDYLARLHELMDKSETLDSDPQVAMGLLTIPLGPFKSPSLQAIVAEISPASVLFQMTFLISCIGFSDVMGKRPKRLVYALEGLGACPTACDSTAENIQQPSPIGLSHIAALNRAIQAIKAELLLDIVALHTFTASFQQADEILDQVICHLRNHNMFETYAPRILLLRAQRYHMLGRKQEAQRFYELCQYTSNPGSEIGLVARTSILFLNLLTSGGNRNERAYLVNELKSELYQTENVLYVAAGKLLEAVTTESISKSKKLLGSGLESSIAASNNQARALFLAVASMHYRDTMKTSSVAMLKTALTITRKLGVERQIEDEHGAVRAERIGPLGLGSWLTERLVEDTRQTDAEYSAKVLDKHKVYQQARRGDDTMI